MPGSNPTIIDRNGPYRQGALDGLCGIYSIVNALTLMVPDYDVQRGFAALVDSLGQSASRVVVRGTSVRQLNSLIRCAANDLAPQGYKLGWRKAFTGQPDTLAEYWHAVKAHHDDHGAGSVIVGLLGRYSHWTCVKKASAKTMFLADSGIMRRLDRSRSTIALHRQHRPHAIVPAHTFLLTVREY